MPALRRFVHFSPGPVAGQFDRLWLFALLLLGAGCGRPPQEDQVQLLVFAAASLTEAFEELSEAFQQAHPEARVSLNLAGSQQLAHQLSLGAPADVFASADWRQMEAAVTSGRVEPGTPALFAGNRLVVVYPPGNPGAIDSLYDLTRSGTRLLLAVDEVPVGRYALTFLDKAATDPAYGPAFSQAVLSNVVSYEENVRAVLSKVQLGEADAGIVYASDVGGPGASSVGVLDIPAHLNVQAEYPIAPIADSRLPELAATFVDFVQSPAGQEVLAGHGLLPAAGGP